MGGTQLPDKAVLIAGLLARDEAYLAQARDAIKLVVGAIEAVSEVWPFTATDYYEDELGTSIVRQFVTFVEPFDTERLAEIKRATNDLEIRIARDAGGSGSSRPINIDPGYLTLAKLVLATTKDRSHRIYLRDGIFAEITLWFEKGRWCPGPWTYADYAAPTYHQFFSQVRSRLKGWLSP